MLRVVALLTLALTIAPAALGFQRVAAQDQKRPAKKESARKDAKEAPAVTPEREAAVNAFVAEHHPELGELLKHLKGIKNQKEYERAIRDLSAVSEKLAGLQKSDSGRYELELKAWKVKSRIQLLSARLTMGDNEDLKYQLKQALAEQYDLRREVLSLEKNRLHERVQKLEKDLIDYDSRREAALDKQFQQLTSTMPKGRPGAKNKTDKPVRSKPTTGS